MKKVFRVCLLAALLAAAAGAASAQQSQPLPAFEVTSLDGRTVKSDELTPNEKWLLVYVQPHCRPCEGLLRTFDGKESGADHTGKVVVVVGGADADEARRMADAAPWLPASSWYADPQKKAAAAAKLRGSPVVMGILRQRVEWNLTGVLADAKSVKSILGTWCEEQTNLPPRPPQ